MKILSLFVAIALFIASCTGQNSSLPPTLTQNTTYPEVVKTPDPAQSNVTRKRTLEAWQAIQKVDGESGALSLPSPDFNLNKIDNIKSYLQFFVRNATGYSQIDLTDVDPLLAEHLAKKLKSHVDAASALESYYSDLAKLVEEIKGNVEIARRLGGVIGDRAGEDIAEFLVKASSDEEVNKKAKAIMDKHGSNIVEKMGNGEAIENNEANVAKQLTEQFGTPFIDAF